MIGTKLGVYEIRSEIGRGASASVYRAYQPNVDRDVAIKVMSKSYMDEEQTINRFQREARLVARLEHPHILPIYDFDGRHNPPYIVMRYLEGGSLRDVQVQQHLPIEAILHITQQVASALDYAHRQGIVHRDIKPSNILFDCDGNAFVSDFGLARLVQGFDNADPLTFSHAIVGTPNYMSPEQATSSPEIDHRVDIYALGVILFEMLTGSLPYIADNAVNMLMMHIQAPIPSAIDRNPDLPPGIDKIFAQVLAKDPRHRYDSALNLAEAISEALREKSSLPLTNQSQPEPRTVFWKSSRPAASDTTGSGTASEQNKIVTALYANAAQYAELMDELSGSEAARRTLGIFWEEARTFIDTFGGLILSRAEDTLLALWGADTTREDDAVRAIQAALAIYAFLQDQIKELDILATNGEAIPLNIGIHTGLALVSPKGKDYTASGATISLANRLMQQAGGSIFITHQTYSLARGIFDVEPGISIPVRRSRQPLQVYKVLAAKPHAFRLNTRGVEGVETHMVGREAELKRLQNAFLDTVEDSETQAVTIVSEAGLGKSRLLYEFMNWIDLRSEPFWLLRGRATPDMLHRPYALLRDVLLTNFKLRENDSPENMRHQLEMGIQERGSQNGETAHLVGYLAGFEFDDSPYIKELVHDPAQLTKRAKTLFKRWVVNLCSINPVIITLEDMHYADEASLDLFNELVSEKSNVALLLICLGRPELYERRPDWGSGQSFHTRLELPPLDTRDSRNLVREILQKVEVVPKNLRELLVERAEGNPYYMEELVKMLVDNRIIVKDSPEVWRVETNRLESLEVPATLTGLLQARLDSLLFPEKITLQRAAVVGRIFYDKALEALDVADDTHLADLPAILSTLTARELILRRESTAFEGCTEYIFARAMLRDVLLNSLLNRQQHTYYVAAAEWLISASAERVDEQSPRIAEYFDRAGENNFAADWYVKAGELSKAQGANQEALRFYNRALELVPPDDHERRWNALFGREKILNILGDAKACLEDIEQLNTLARLLKDDDKLAEILFAKGFQNATLGQYAMGLQAYDEALLVAKRANNRKIEAQILGAKVVGLTHLGNLEAAATTAEEALQYAVEAGDEETLVRNYLNVSVYYSTIGDFARSIHLLDQCVTINHRSGNRYGEAISLSNLGYYYTILGLYSSGRTTLEQSLKLTEAIEARRLSHYNRINLGLCYLRSGDYPAAIQVLELATQEALTTPDPFAQVSCQFYMAMVLEVTGKIPEAEQEYHQAWTRYNDLEMPNYALDASAGLARCLQSQGKVIEALVHAVKVWEHLESHGSEGLEFPLMAYLTCVESFEAVKDNTNTQIVLKAAQKVLMDLANKISDPEWRKSYLDNIPEHRTILERYDQLQET